MTPERMAELRRRPDLIDSDEGEVIWLLDEIQKWKDLHEVAHRFHDVAVAERNAAWAKIDRLRGMLSECKKNLGPVCPTTWRKDIA